ncbi:MAG: hypothetical protein HYT29_01625 [Parcubacteria group bacterium]|nr:hypothetical protein [Parcubacteria group bacterium]
MTYRWYVIDGARKTRPTNEEGREVLGALVHEGAINEADRARLTHQLLGESGLPTTKEEAVINDFSGSYGFASQVALERSIENLVSSHDVSAAGAEAIRNRIAAMPDEQKIAAAVLLLRDQDLDDPVVQEQIAADVEPGLIDRIKEAVKKYQTEHPRSAGLEVVDSSDDGRS